MRHSFVGMVKGGVFRLPTPVTMSGAMAVGLGVSMGVGVAVGMAVGVRVGVGVGVGVGAEVRIGVGVGLGVGAGMSAGVVRGGAVKTGYSGVRVGVAPRPCGKERPMINKTRPPPATIPQVLNPFFLMALTTSIRTPIEIAKNPVKPKKASTSASS